MKTQINKKFDSIILHYGHYMYILYHYSCVTKAMTDAFVLHSIEPRNGKMKPYPYRLGQIGTDWNG